MTCKMTQEIYDKLSLTLLYSKREFILLHSVLINGVVETLKISQSFKSENLKIICRDKTAAGFNVIVKLTAKIS